MTTTARRSLHRQGHAPHREVTHTDRQHPHQGSTGTQRETPTGVGGEVSAEMTTMTSMTSMTTGQADAPSLSALLDLRTQAQSVGAAVPCRDNDAELWFAERPEDVEFAKALCRTCPALAECFAGAVERREPWGVWGGQLFVQGVVVPRKRPRGRPRKNEIAA